jgi:uncharacterized membrane protein YphA (DoxX/SURF4 family)
MELIVLLVRGILGWLLLTAGVEKLWRNGATNARPQASALTARYPRIVLYALVVLELLAGGALFAPRVWSVGAVAAVLLVWWLHRRDQFGGLP